MLGTNGNKGRLIFSQQELLAVDRYLPRPGEDHPVLGAVVVHLHGERPARLDGDTVNVEPRRLDHHIAAAPRTVDFAVSFVFAALVGLQVLHDLFHVLGAVFIHHQHRILGADDHQVLNADSRHQLFVAVDVAVLAVVHPGIAGQHVAQLIFRADVPQG